MIDIVSTGPGLDIGIYDTETEKAKNILSVQLGSLEYAKELGIDLRYFLTESFSFQNESFKAYIVEVLANNSINVSSVLETVESLYSTYVINVVPQENSTGFIAR